MRILPCKPTRVVACLLAGAALLCAHALAALPARAMSVSPVYLDMVSAGAGSRADIRVVNSSQRPLPIETVISRVTRDADGNEIVERNEADFLVLPMQAMIPPGGSQILKVQWLGDPLIEESREYRISVNQLPVAAPQSEKAVQVVLNLAVVVHVAPPKAAPALELVSHGTARAGDGKRIPTITVRNPSRVHARLPDATLKLKAGSWSKVLTPAALDALLGIGAVMPGRTRTFRLPVSLPGGAQGLQAQLDYRSPGQR